MMMLSAFMPRMIICLMPPGTRLPNLRRRSQIRSLQVHHSAAECFNLVYQENTSANDHTLTLLKEELCPESVKLRVKPTNRAIYQLKHGAMGAIRVQDKALQAAQQPLAKAMYRTMRVAEVITSDNMDPSSANNQTAGTQLTLVSTIPSSTITSGKAGNVKHCLQAWGTITSDLSTLAIIEVGVTLDFIGLPPENSPTGTVFPSVTLPGMAEELLNLGRNEVFIPTIWESGSFISPIFTTKKSDGSPRLILNLKKLNCYIRYVHFKMESLGDVLNIIKPGVWMASVDLQEAYYTIPVHPDHQKYLTFSWQHKYYKFTCLPNGYAQAPMLFTKLLKHLFSFLRRRGHHSIIYIADAYLQGDS